MSNAFDTRARREKHDWTADEIYMLTRLWTEGFSGTEIGRHLGITKSAAIGKVRRLRLAAHPIAIRRRDALPPARAIYAAPEAVDPRRLAAARDARYREFAAQPWEPDKPCQFPLWGDERPTHEYCGAVRVVGTPYCAAHMAVAYVKPPPEKA